MPYKERDYYTQFIRYLVSDKLQNPSDTLVDTYQIPSF
jgi:hypothetical protein